MHYIFGLLFNFFLLRVHVAFWVSHKYSQLSLFLYIFTNYLINNQQIQ